MAIPCPQKGGKFYPILLHKFITDRTGKIYLLFPDGLYTNGQYAFGHQNVFYPLTHSQFAITGENYFTRLYFTRHHQSSVQLESSYLSMSNLMRLTRIGSTPHLKHLYSLYWFFVYVHWEKFTKYGLFNQKGSRFCQYTGGTRDTPIWAFFLMKKSRMYVYWSTIILLLIMHFLFSI